MRRFCLTFAPATFLLLAWAGLASAQFGPMPLRAMPELPADPQQPTAMRMALRVEASPQLAKSRGDLARSVAAKLNAAKIGIFEDRFQHFAQLISPNSNPVVGWQGTLEFIEPLGPGLLVTVRVRACQGHHFDNASLMEQYSIVNGSVKYAGSFMPPPYPRFIAGF